VRKTTRLRSRSLRCLASACLGLALGARPAAQADGLGNITFPSSGSASARPDFLRGVAALHSFEYEDANQAFQRARTIDPGFVMAYWGEAMTYNQTLWRQENIEAAREALAHLRTTAAASGMKTATPKEKSFLSAVTILFGDGDAVVRHRNYADAMARLYASYPDDPEVASFYALALLGTMSRSLIGYVDAHEGHSQMLAGSATQAQVAAILEGVLKAHPGHPGALHYLLHDDDDPEHAQQALAAARAYAKVAPRSSHARHMPAHIFFQLGMWNDAAASDRAAFAVSGEVVTTRGLPLSMRSYHALSWLEYELLQLGRYGEAWDTIGEIAPVVKDTGLLPLLSDLSSMRARYVIETGRWDVMARERNFGNVNELFAIGVSAARSGNATSAEMARQGLADRARSEQEGDLRPAIVIMERELAALIDLVAGRREQTAAILRAASQSELQLPPPLGLPEPIKPAPEMLGEVLLELGQPRDARAAFEQALRRNPNRSLSVLGLARAAAALGDQDTARQHYGALLANYGSADADLAVLKEARAALEPRSTSGFRLLTVAGLSIALAALLIAAALTMRRRKARPAFADATDGSGRSSRQGSAANEGGASSRRPLEPRSSRAGQHPRGRKVRGR
jgi:tetratricopeptide (TPR) repeat protein